ncbi:MAG: hypothetical protein J6S26_02035, partial [Solobacterium sp.]|nr:hypothetical protein [Solobacterium sp.]
MEDWNNNRYPDDYYSSDYDYDMDSPYPEPLPIPEEKPKSILNIPPAQTHFDDSVLDDPTAGRKKKEPLKSPRSRPSISTNRVFSPYGLSFFDDAVTTRELSDSERTRIMNRTAVQNAERDMTSSRRMLTPESNVFPSQGSQEPARRPSQRQPRQTSRSADPYASAGQMPSQGSSRRTQPPAFSAPKSSQPSYSAYSPTSLMNPGSSYSGYGSSGSSGPMLTPGNNLFPEDDLSVVHQTGEFDRTVPASSLSYTRTPSSTKPSSSRPQSSGSYATQSNTLSPYGFRADAAADPFESFPDQVPPARTAPAASSAPAFTPSTASAPASGTTGTNSYIDFLGGNTSANKTAAPAASDPLTNTMGATGY